MVRSCKYLHILHCTAPSSVPGSHLMWVTMQPWAQLLVHGIKRIEGRGWGSTHRGRIWVHATSQQPTAETIQASGPSHAPPVLASVSRPVQAACSIMKPAGRE